MWALVAFLLSSMVAGEALAHSVRSPSKPTVKYTDLTTWTATLPSGVHSVNGFIAVDIVADFVCAQNEWVRQAWVQTPYDMGFKNLPKSTAYHVANVKMPTTLLISHPRLVVQLNNGEKTSGSLQVPVQLHAVCVNSHETTHSKAVRVVSQSTTITVNLTYSGQHVTSSFVLPAIATPTRYWHTCAQYGLNVAGTNSARANSHSMLPLQCGNTYDPKHPKLSIPQPDRALQKCRYSGWVFVGYATGSAEEQISTGSMSHLGTLEVCHYRHDGSKYHGAPVILQRAVLHANLLKNLFTEDKIARFKMHMEVPPKRTPTQICKWSDYRFTRGADMMLVGKFGDTNCNTARDLQVNYDVSIGNMRDEVRSACQKKARQLKLTGGWNGLPKSGVGRVYTATGYFKPGFVGRFCHAPRSWKTRKWYEIFSYHEKLAYNCQDYPNNTFWSGPISVPFTVRCISK